LNTQKDVTDHGTGSVLTASDKRVDGIVVLRSFD